MKINEATGEFKMTLPIEKSFTREVEGEERKYIAGLASGTEIDHDDERMNTSAILAFKSAIEEGIILEPNGTWSMIPLRSGHRKEWDDILGWVVKADVDEHNNLWIEAELNNTSAANDLYTILTTPQKKGRPYELGFSVGGKIKKVSREWNQEKQKSIRVFDEIGLGEISVTGKPAYPPSYLDVLTKSVNWEEVPKTQQEIKFDTKEIPMSQDATKEVVTETIDLTKDANNVSVPSVTEKAEDADTQGDMFKAFNSRLDELETLIKSVATQKETVEVLKTDVVTPTAVVPEVAKAATQDAPSIDVEALQKSLEASFATALTTALASFKTDAIDPVVAELTTVKATVQEISDQPVDKSHAVRTAKENESVIEKFHSNVAEKTANNVKPNYIEEAVKLAVR